MSKERQVYAAVLGLGLTILVVDRVFLGGATSPASASAAAPAGAQDLVLASTAPTAQATAAAEEETAPALAGRLNGLRDSLPREALGAGLFSGNAEWLKPLPSEKPAAATAADPALGELVARHRITSVVTPHGAAPVVVIDGERRTIGDVVDGMTIALIESNAVTFERNGAVHKETLYEAPSRPIRNGPVQPPAGGGAKPRSPRDNS